MTSEQEQKLGDLRGTTALEMIFLTGRDLLGARITRILLQKLSTFSSALKPYPFPNSTIYRQSRCERSRSMSGLGVGAATNSRGVVSIEPLSS